MATVVADAVESTGLASAGRNCPQYIEPLRCLLSPGAPVQLLRNQSPELDHHIEVSPQVEICINQAFMFIAATGALYLFVHMLVRVE